MPGIRLVSEAVSQEYADLLVSQLPPEFTISSPKKEEQSSMTRASLQLHHFSPLPEWISMVSEDVIPNDWKTDHWSGEECNTSIVQRYKPGEGIRWHVDLPSFGDGVAILSLLSTVRMRFRRVNDHSDIEEIVLPPRSLLLFWGEARYDWEHTIEGVYNDRIDGKQVPRQERISFTLRRIAVEAR